jgi:predicted nucleic acid-binding protein
MIILDTNVVSELMRPQPSAPVLTWVGNQPVRELCTTSISEAEVFYGIRLLPRGKRREALLSGAEGVFSEDLGGRVLGFDRDAARAFSEIVVHRRSLGRPINFADAQIASIARVSGATLATRDTDDFEDCGIEVVNPWTAD